MPKGHVNVQAEEAKTNTKNQEELLAGIATEHLPEVAALFGIPEDKIPEGASREDLLKLIQAAKRHDISVAKTIEVDGKEMECPVGYAIIRVTPKSGVEWGQRSKEMWFVAMQGTACIGRRGRPVLIHEKFLSCFKDAVRKVYSQDAESLTVDYNRNGSKLNVHEEYAEDFNILAHAPDLEEAKRVEEDLKANAIEFQKEIKAQKAYKRALVENFGNPR